MKKTLYLLVLLVILVVGCKPTEKIIKEPYPVIERHDSIVRITVHDTVASYPKQKQSVVTLRNSFLSTDLASSKAWIDSTGLLHHSIENKGIIPAKITNRVTSASHIKPVIKEVPVDRPVPVVKEVQVRGFLWYSGLFFYISLFLITLYKLKQKLSLWQNLTKGL